jgi:hypothetical protein
MDWVYSWDTGDKDYVRNFDMKTPWKRVLGRTWDWRAHIFEKSGWRVDRTSSGSCQMAGFCIRGVTH